MERACLCLLAALREGSPDKKVSVVLLIKLRETKKLSVGSLYSQFSLHEYRLLSSIYTSGFFLLF